ncbi:MAG: hypothetical protein MPJ24_01530 [Pirellulaceae bacterium]|nr:hypothetical protein [Pirellulaceae bacterium]
MDPSITIKFRTPQEVFHPNDRLEVEYYVEASDLSSLNAMEISLLWYTEGKGEQDIYVHSFERRERRNVANRDLSQVFLFQCQLPKTPLSYHGTILKIHWCIRVTTQFKKGKTFYEDRPILLLPTGKVLKLQQTSHL